MSKDIIYGAALIASAIMNEVTDKRERTAAQFTVQAEMKFNCGGSGTKFLECAGSTSPS